MRMRVRLQNQMTTQIRDYQTEIFNLMTRQFIANGRKGFNAMKLSRIESGASSAPS